MITGPLRVDNRIMNEAWMVQPVENDEMQIDVDVEKMSMNQKIIVHDLTIPFSKFNIAPGSQISI